MEPDIKLILLMKECVTCRLAKKGSFINGIIKGNFCDVRSRNWGSVWWCSWEEYFGRSFGKLPLENIT
jgi:hypothetical protein